MLALKAWHTTQRLVLLGVMHIVEVVRHFLDAGVAQLVEHELPKLGVAGSIPVSRSIHSFSQNFPIPHFP